MKQEYLPLGREEVVRAIERSGPSRIPLVRAKWWGVGLEEQYGESLRTLDRYPEDVEWLFMNSPVDPAVMNLSWEWETGGAKDSICVLDDWAKLDEFIEKMPTPENDPRLHRLATLAERAQAKGRYTLYGFWCLYFEGVWKLRGMENLMCDYYTETEKVHQLHQALCNTYCAYIRESARVLRPDGFWSSDDLGHQTAPMVSPRLFHDLIYPYYATLGETIHENGMHFWLHSCGCNTPLLPDLISAGLDVFHPVQKYTMDEVNVAAQFGNQLSFLAGIDVQHILQEQDPTGVRAEVRFLIDTFDRPEGGMLIAAGNGIVEGTPYENIEAFLDEAVVYGAKHRASHRESV